MALETLIAIFIALLVGAGFPVQAGINATIAQYHGHPLLAAFTNTTPIERKLEACSKLKPLSVAPLLGEAIRRIHENSSVSSLFV